MKNLLKNLFSVENEDAHKVLTLFGIKLKLYSATLTKINEQQEQIEQQKQELSCQRDEIEQQKQQINCQRNDLFCEIQNKRDELYRHTYDLVKKTTPMAELRNFEVHIVEHCNLNCQCCNHFTPLAEKEFMTVEAFTKDFQRMAELTGGNVSLINLLGGEPLLHPDLLDFFPIARRLFPNTKINVVSNGILLPEQSDEFWEACQKYNITVCCTKYPINIDWNAINRKAAQFNLEIEYWMDGDEIKHSWIFPMDLAGKQDATANFINCRDANSCIFLRDGKLFTCVVPPNVHHFNKHFDKNIPVTERDYIDIYKAKDIYEILGFLSRPIPFCKYCNVNGRKYDLEWKTSTKKIEEWTN